MQVLSSDNETKPQKVIWLQSITVYLLVNESIVATMLKIHFLLNCCQKVGENHVSKCGGSFPPLFIFSIFFRILKISSYFF